MVAQSNKFNSLNTSHKPNQKRRNHYNLRCKCNRRRSHCLASRSNSSEDSKGPQLKWRLAHHLSIGKRNRKKVDPNRKRKKLSLKALSKSRAVCWKVGKLTRGPCLKVKVLCNSKNRRSQTLSCSSSKDACPPNPRVNRTLRLSALSASRR